MNSIKRLIPTGLRRRIQDHSGITELQERISQLEDIVYQPSTTTITQRRTQNNKQHFVKSYMKHTSQLLDKHDKEKAMSLAIGGDFETGGRLQFYLLRDAGLEKHHNVIDVGCGSGRLAVQLAPFLEGRYIGFDVVPELVDYAEELCQRPDWSFLIAPGLTIPADDNFADIVCFFSVFTHLLHEESFLYLREAKRVLKTNGRIIFSFLEFSMPNHWVVFEKSAVNDTAPDKVHTQFMSREAIKVWASHLDLKVEAIYDGDKPHIPLPEVLRWDNGKEMRGKGNLGQSVCILSKS